MPGRVTRLNVDEVFTYHAPDEAQQLDYFAIRAAAQAFARVILQHTPECADQQAALRKLREAVMTASAAVALRGEV